MTPRERADEVMDVTWGGWGSGDPWQHVPAFVAHRDRIEAAIGAATAEATARAEEAERERDVASFGRDRWRTRAEAAEKALRDMIGADWEGKL